MNHPSAFAPRTCMRGFNLIEMMVAVAVLSILVTIAAPSMIDLIRDSRLAAQSDMLVSALNTARLEAVKQRTNFSVCAAENPTVASACSGAVAGWSRGWVVISAGAPGVVALRGEPRPDLTVTASAAATTFNATLGSATAAATYTLCISGRRQHVVTVTLSGHVGKRIADAVCA